MGVGRPRRRRGTAEKTDGMRNGIDLGLGIAQINAHHHTFHAGDAGVEVARIVVPLTAGEIELSGIGVLTKFDDVEAHFRKTIERNPLRQSLVAQQTAGARRAVDRDHQRGQAERHHHERNQHLDQRKAANTAELHQLRFSTLFEPCRETFPIASPSTAALACVASRSKIRRNGVPSPLAAIATWGLGCLPMEQLPSMGLMTTVWESSWS